MDNVTKRMDEGDPEFKLRIIRAQAVKQATFEVIGENRNEIIKRARAKLVSLGIEVRDNELGAQLE